MRVLVWNMGCGGPGASEARHQTAWDYLEQQAWDVALLQETRTPPDWAQASYASLVWRPKYAHTRPGRGLWGCAIIARHAELTACEPGEDFPWLREREGSTAIARAAGEPRWLASVHLHASEIPAGIVSAHSVEGIEVPTRDGSIWEQNVIPHELHRLFASETFIWGGDFNSEPRMDTLLRHTRGGNQRNFEIYAEYGSRDTRARFFDSYQQTYVKANRKAWQLDHAFADPRTEERVEDWRVDLDAATCTPPYSDHAPILITLAD